VEARDLAEIYRKLQKSTEFKGNQRKCQRVEFDAGLVTRGKMTGLDKK